LYVPQADIVA